MPAIGSALSDEDIAAVLSYIRTSWGNKASPIKAEQVSAVRKKVGNRTLAFTPEELMQVQ
jgi:cytochrome c6